MKIEVGRGGETWGNLGKGVKGKCVHTRAHGLLNKRNGEIRPSTGLRPLLHDRN